MGGGAGGGSVEDARGRPTALGGVATTILLLVGLGGTGCTAEAAYGCTVGPTGVRGDKEVSSETIALPVASIVSDRSSGGRSVSDDPRKSSSDLREEVEEVLERVPELSEVGEVDEGEDGCVETVDTETDEDA